MPLISGLSSSGTMYLWYAAVGFVFALPFISPRNPFGSRMKVQYGSHQVSLPILTGLRRLRMRSSVLVCPTTFPQCPMALASSEQYDRDSFHHAHPSGNWMSTSSPSCGWSLPLTCSCHSFS